MPIYEYKCLKCGNQLEVMQKISDAPLQECPRCQGKLEKQWSLSGFQFKGTGWYVSDYGKQGADAERKADSKTQNSAESGSSESNAENKTEKSSDTKNTANDAAKTSSDSESTSAKASASNPESKPAENKPTAKID